jgi:hypothetical protein
MKGDPDYSPATGPLGSHPPRSRPRGLSPVAVNNSRRAGPHPERRRGLGAIGRAGPKSGADPWGRRRRSPYPQSFGEAGRPVGTSTARGWLRLYRGGILRPHDARAQELEPRLDLVAVRGEGVAPFRRRPGAVAVTLGVGEERREERTPEPLRRFL